MSGGQYISGNMSSIQISELGELITVGNIRMRKGSIQAYMGHFNKETNQFDGISLLIGHGWLLADLEAEMVPLKLQQLDAMYRKEYAQSGLEVVGES